MARSEALKTQLSKEVGQGHILASNLSQLNVVAARGDQDDILVTDDSSDTFFIVHLTWNAGGTQDKTFPNTVKLKAQSDQRLEH
ncbi:MAG: hypothetical protein AAF429_02870 [Pseudomonadota bacterium]